LDIATESLSDARVVGWTSSGSSFPSTISLGSPGGPTDAFFARIVTTGTSTSNPNSIAKIGGSGSDIATSVAVDSSLNTYVAGDTSSPVSANFPATAGVLQGSLSGPTDAFVSKLGPSTTGLTFTCTGTGCLANPTVSPSPVNVGGQVTIKYSIYNNGDPVSGVVFTTGIGQNSSFVSATASSGTCGGVSGGNVICNLGTVNTSSSAATAAATVTVVVSATTQVLQQPITIGNSGTLSVPGTPFTPITVSGNAVVNDFTVSATPTSVTVTAGAQADYSVLVKPTGGGFAAAVSLSCGSGLPSGASCVFTNNPIPNLNNGPQSRALAITTTFRVTTPGSLFLPGGSTYALWLPLLGASLLGAGISRKRRILLGVFFAVVLVMTMLQLGCGSSNKSTSTTTGTPAGTYTVTVNATAGATRTTTVTLVVK
jgi:hypothetical protein